MAFLSSRLAVRLGRAMDRMKVRYDPPADVRVSLVEANYEVPRDLEELFALRQGASEVFLVRNNGRGMARSVTIRPRSTIASEEMAVFRASNLPIPELSPGDCTPISGRWSSGRCQPPYFVEVSWEDSHGAQRRTQHINLPQ